MTVFLFLATFLGTFLGLMCGAGLVLWLLEYRDGLSLPEPQSWQPPFSDWIVTPSGARFEERQN